MRKSGLIWLCVGLFVSAAALADPGVTSPPADAVETATCGIVESAARTAHVPVGFLTRLVWVESRFQAEATSPAGAQGIAQFMPGTAAERGLADPYDPEKAIPAAANLLADLRQQFGNFGLAAAAYNAGAARVAGWLDGSGGLPIQTQDYVFSLTGRTAADWAADRQRAGPGNQPADNQSCIAVTALFRAEAGEADTVPIAPWGVQLAGNFSKAIALASFERMRSRFASIIGDRRPMVIGTRLRSRGTRRFYRVMVPAQSRSEADRVCRLVIAAGGACTALRT